MSATSEIPPATVGRLPGYWRVMRDLVDAGANIVSSTELAEAAGVNSAQLRRDLSYLGSYGTRGVGYDVAVLSERIGHHLGGGRRWPVVIVGAGNIGRALARHHADDEHFRVVGLFDADPALVGSLVGGVIVSAMSDLEAIVASTGAALAIVAVPGTEAQSVCDLLAAAGVTSILNFAPITVVPAEGVNVRGVDLTQELQILAFHAARRRSASENGPGI